MLKLALTEFSLPKFYRLFGISSLTVKSLASTAFRAPPLKLALSVHASVDYSAAPASTTLPSARDDVLSLPSLETVTDALIEILEVSSFSSFWMHAHKIFMKFT